MDLLNSILNSMDASKPPQNTEQQKKVIKRQKEIAEKMKNKEKEELLRFRKHVEDRLQRFSNDERPLIEFQPLDKLHRAIIHDLSEFGGFLAMSFGIEDLDRYTVVYKKENAPTEDEIFARRNGEGWNDSVAKEYADRRKDNEIKRLAARVSAQKNNSNSNNKNDSSSSATSNDVNSEIKPNTNYKDKYAHIIGQEAALEAARKTETNLNYGFVPSKNKKDVRSIEQTLADIQAKKKIKLQQQQEQQQLQEQAQEHVQNEQQSRVEE